MKIILDTNIYRNLVRKKNLSELLSNEEIDILSENINEYNKENDHVIQFPIVTAMELIAHWNDDNPIHKNECRKALQLLVNTSIFYKSETESLHCSFIPPMNAVLSVYFFNKDDKYSAMYSQTMKLALLLTGKLNNDSNYTIDELVDKWKEQIVFEKTEIQQNYINYLKSLNGGIVDWNYYQKNKKEKELYNKELKNHQLSIGVATGMMERAFTLNEIEFKKDEESLEKLSTFIEDFTPVLVMNEMLLDNVMQGVPALDNIEDPRWNTVMDISILFGVLHKSMKEQEIVGKPNVLFATEDKNMVKAIQECPTYILLAILEEIKKMYSID